MTGLHVAQLRSTVKKTVNLELGPRTIIVGANGAGKTAIAAALELVLTGRTEEVANTPASLVALKAAGSSSLAVQALLSAGQEISYEVRGSSARAHKPRWSLSQPAGTILNHEIKALLRGDSKRLRRALLRMVCGRDGDVLSLLSKRIPSAFSETWGLMWADAVRAADAGTPSAEILVSVVSALEHQLRTCKRVAKTPLSLTADDKQVVLARYWAAAAELYERTVQHKPPHCRACGAAPDAWRLDLAGQAISDAQAALNEQRGSEALNDQQLAELKALKQAADGVITDLLVYGAQDIEQRAKAIGIPLFLRLMNSDREVCSFGLRLGELEVEYAQLSGAQRCSVLAAIAQCSKAQGLRMLIIDDVALDASWLGLLAEALRKSKIDQVIVTVLPEVWNVCKGRCTGWKVVEL